MGVIFLHFSLHYYHILQWFLILLATLLATLSKKISIRYFHQMLVCQKYGGVAEIRTRASLATPNDLANRPLQPA